MTSDTATQRSALATPTPWEQNTGRGRPSSESGSQSYNRDSRDQFNRRDSRETGSQRDRVERLTAASRLHKRNESGTASSGDFEHQHQPNGRRHDYDVQSMETDLSPRPGVMKNPIPAPTVTIRSEFPTLNRSRQQQPLTCLITVEVPDGNWRPDADDLRHTAGPPQEEPYVNARSPAVRDSRSTQYEPQETLDEIAEELRTRVDNWHGLEFQRWVPPLLNVVADE